MRKFLLAGFILVFIFNSLFSTEKESILSDKTIRALNNEISGERALDYIRHIALHKRDQASDEYHLAAEWVLKTAKTFGLSDVQIEKYPADGNIYYYMQKTRGGWDAEFAELWITEPQEEKLTSYASIPLSLANRSQSCDYMGQLVYIGDGTKPENYRHHKVKNKIVLAEGSASKVAEMAVDRHGALGVVHINQRFAHDEPDNVSRVRIFTKKKSFVFSLSHRRGEKLKARLLRGEKITVRGIVKASIHPGFYENVVATIPGTDLAKEEILLVAHLCHYKPGANDNGSGSAALLEIGRTLTRLIKEGKISRPKRTIRFLWVPEMSGSIAYAAKHPDIMGRMIAGINFDMVGQYLNKNNSTFYLNCTPHSQPHYINDLFTNIVEYIGRNSVESLSGNQEYAPAILSLSGSRDSLRYRISPYTGGSDQYIFNDGLLNVPTVFLFVWPDRYYHTSGDKPEICDPTQLKRSSYIGAAALTVLMDDCPDKSRRLAVEVSNRANSRITSEIKRAMNLIEHSTKSSLHTANKEGINFINQIYKRETATLKSLKNYSRRDQAVDGYINGLITKLAQQKRISKLNLKAFYTLICKTRNILPQGVRTTNAERAAMSTIPIRIKSLKGPPDNNYLKEKLKGKEVDMDHPIHKVDSRYRYEILNFVDGKNTLMDIRNAVSAEYQPIPVQWVKQYLELLQKAGIIKM